MNRLRLLALVVVVGALTGSAALVWQWLYDEKPPPSTELLQRRLVGANRLVVRTGGTCHRDIAEEKVLFTVTSPKLVAEVADHLRVTAGGFRCGCCGYPTLEFYRAHWLVASVSVHHGEFIRWEGWNSDGVLTQESAEYLEAFLRLCGLDPEDYR